MSKERDYVDRTYRSLHRAGDLHYFNIRIKQSDLAIGVDRKSYSDSLVPLCRQEVIRLRGELEDYIKLHPEFATSLVPLKILSGAPPLVQQMTRAAAVADVGPMAAVAGTLAQALGEKLKTRCQECVVENGGDIYLHSYRERKIAVFAGTSPFSYKIAIRVYPEESPLGICTSSGTVGPSLSFGKADAVVIKARDTAIADAVATAAANRVKTESDLLKAIKYVKSIEQVTGILVIKNDQMAAWGKIEITPLTGRMKHESS
jgi:ApbE superfamily uncharacterized protein (UPF0280 family)